MATPRKIKVTAPLRIDFAGGMTDISPFCDQVGGAVVNATIDKYVTGIQSVDEMGRVHIEYTSDVGARVGLGLSGAMNVVWLKLVLPDLDERAIAEKSYWLEKLLGIPGGRQDQYSAAVGGFNLMSFILNQVDVHPIHMTSASQKKLWEHLLLVDSGGVRRAPDFTAKVMRKFEAGEPEICDGLAMIREAAHRLKPALESSDLKAIANFININWEGQRMLSKTVSNPRMDKLFNIAFANGAIAGKACGAGGGGCVLLLGDKKAMTAAIESEFEIIPFQFVAHGVKTEVRS